MERCQRDMRQILEGAASHGLLWWNRPKFNPNSVRIKYGGGLGAPKLITCIYDAPEIKIEETLVEDGHHQVKLDLKEYKEHAW